MVVYTPGKLECYLAWLSGYIKDSSVAPHHSLKTSICERTKAVQDTHPSRPGWDLGFISPLYRETVVEGAPGPICYFASSWIYTQHLGRVPSWGLACPQLRTWDGLESPQLRELGWPLTCPFPRFAEAEVR